eukprot:GHRR01026431.1.p1 GENE.GHRR01026431.1~~GHRR01026431.1.p1  ORF type:complete len:136 (+),score=25.71 GHRR01026431.1:215-622(+)
MGHAAAEAVVKAGLTLVPFTLTGYSAGVAVSNIGVAGIPVEVVGRDRRQEIMSRIQDKHPDLIIVDYTTPNCVNGEEPIQRFPEGCTHVSALLCTSKQLWMLVFSNCACCGSPGALTSSICGLSPCIFVLSEKPT